MMLRILKGGSRLYMNQNSIYRVVTVASLYSCNILLNLSGKDMYQDPGEFLSHCFLTKMIIRYKSLYLTRDDITIRSNIQYIVYK